MQDQQESKINQSSIHTGTSSGSSSEVLLFGVGENAYQILTEKNIMHVIVPPQKQSQQSSQKVEAAAAVDLSNMRVVSVSCGGDFLMLILKDKITGQSRLFSAGYNGTGEQGVPCPSGSSSPLRDITDHVHAQINRRNMKILQAHCGWNHSMILVEYDDMGEDDDHMKGSLVGGDLKLGLYGSGFNNHGQLSIGATNSTTSFTRAITDQIPLHQLERLISRFNTCAIITKDRTLYACGNNSNGELGKPNTIHKFEHVFNQVLDADFSYSHSVLIDMNGQIWTAGRNEYGKLGRPDENNSHEFVMVPNFTEKAIKVSLGIHHTMILTQSGHIYGCGYNDSGELGNNDCKSSPILVRVQSDYLFRDVSCGFYSTSFLSLDNQVMACGGCQWKTLDGTTEKKLVPKLLDCLESEKDLYRNVNAIQSGGYFLVAFYRESSLTRQVREMFKKLKNLVNGHELSDITIHV